MTPKQALVAHLASQHGEHVHRGTHQHWITWHQDDHHSRHLTHQHRFLGYKDGGEQIDVTITLAPPKNASASRSQDRNWSLHVANLSQGSGWRYEIPGTRAGDPDGAINEANKLLGWIADWEPVGWGWKVIDKEKS
jgi:hypothetical protein